MKRAFVWILTLLMMVSVCACAEPEDAFFARLEGIEWSFSSGVGGWSTDMRILPDGSFSGEYHDSEMGELADEYPNGTLYLCSFTGHMTMTGQLDENTWTIRVDDLKVDEGQPQESIEDGFRFVFAEPYGLSAGDEMRLYQPGTPTDGFTEDMRMWAHLLGDEGNAAALDFWFLYSDKNESGFVGYPNDEPVGLANPWQDMTAEQLLDVSGISFGVPEGAENVIYRWLSVEGLAEMQFTWNGDDFCARAEAAELEDGALMEISGMYFSWENEEDILVGNCPGTIGMAQTGSEDWVERCLWYDADTKVMYSLSVATTDPDGLDLVAMAEMIYRPNAQ